MQDNAVCFVQHRHVYNSYASEGHVVKVGGQSELIAERMYALR